MVSSLEIKLICTKPNKVLHSNYKMGGATKESGMPSKTQFRESKTSENPASLKKAPPSSNCAGIIKEVSKELSCGRVMCPDGPSMSWLAAIAAAKTVRKVEPKLGHEALTLHFLKTFHGSESLSPTPHSVVDMAHTHSAADLEL